MSQRANFHETYLGQNLLLLHSSGLSFHAPSKALVVANLFMEKSRKTTHATDPNHEARLLDKLRYLCHTTFLMQAKYVVAVGRSFHDKEGPARLSQAIHQVINQIRMQAEWVWVLDSENFEQFPKWADRVCDHLILDQLHIRCRPQPLQEDQYEMSVRPSSNSKQGTSILEQNYGFEGQRLLLPDYAFRKSMTIPQFASPQTSAIETPPPHRMEMKSDFLGQHPLELRI